MSMCCIEAVGLLVSHHVAGMLVLAVPLEGEPGWQVDAPAEFSLWVPSSWRSALVANVCRPFRLGGFCPTIQFFAAGGVWCC